MSAKKQEKPIHPFIDKEICFSDLKIHSLWDTVYSGNYAFSSELHSHFHYEIQICTHGEYLIESDNGDSITMKENELCLLPMGYAHSSRTLTDAAKRLALRFYLNRNPNQDDTSGCFHSISSTLKELKNPIHIYSDHLTDLIKEIHNELYIIGNRPGITSELLLVQFFSDLFSKLIHNNEKVSDMKSSNQDTLNSRAYKIEQFFYENYSEQATEAELAELLNLSLRQTAREIKTLYGVSFREKLIQIRMVNAAKLLVSTDFSVSFIAEKVGYTSAPGFCTSFKKFYGMSPLEYKVQ